MWSFAEVAGCTSALVSILLFVAAFPVLFHMRKQLACPESWHFMRRRFPARNTRRARQYFVLDEFGKLLALKADDLAHVTPSDSDPRFVAPLGVVGVATQIAPLLRGRESKMLFLRRNKKVVAAKAQALGLVYFHLIVPSG
jgi:hypothetical protein